MTRGFVFSLFAVAAFAAETKLPPAATLKVDFDQHVKPILAAKCYSCHGANPQAGLRLDKRQNALRGGDYGPVIVPGDSANSKLIKRLVSGDGGLQMPPTGPLESDDIGILRAWIDQGAEFGKVVDVERKPKPADPAMTKLIDAIRAQDAKAVREQIAAKPNLTKDGDPSGSTALHYAAGFGAVEIMKGLLAAGAPVDAKNRLKSTPLHWAVHDPAKVRLLLDGGADVNAKGVDGRAALYFAATLRTGNSVLELLLSRGADPNTKMLTGRTPLMAAAAAGNLEAMKMLLAKKADPTLLAGTGGSALFDAAGSGKIDAVKLLLDAGLAADSRNKRGVTPLAVAAIDGSEDIARLLIDRGADVNSVETDGYTPLMLAVSSEAQPVGIVKLLLAKGAKTEGTGLGETLLTLAAKRGDTEIARLVGVSEAARKTRGVATGEPGSAEDRPVGPAITKALELVAKQSPIFIKTGGCNSCHNQDLPSAASALARDRGIPAPRSIARLADATVERSSDRLMAHQFIAISSLAYEMLDKIWNHEPPSAYTDAAVHLLKTHQNADGHWSAGGGRRPPLTNDPFWSTAMSVQALRTYAPPAQKADTEERIARAAAWLESAKPETAQERAFHLAGLVWSGAKASAIDRAARALIAAQREDGGWSQLDGMGSDAYASGQSLYALQIAGKSPGDAAVKKGVKFLLRTQAPDGSWHVKTRALPFQPYFDAGFPYGHDQWISVAGTSWASMALALTVEPTRVTRASSR